MPSVQFVLVAAVTLFAVVAVAQPAGSNYKGFLMLNKVINGSIPRSFAVEPPNYFELVPNSSKLNHYNTSHYIAPCGMNASADQMNAYMFQTETWLSTLGLNIYDGAVRCIALSLLGEVQECLNYTINTLVDHKTVQFPNIRANAPCQGVVEYGQCTDPNQDGACGLCYGDGATNAEKTLTINDAYFFRMIGDFWAIQGTVDQRCPQRHLMWTWNDYKPILGENAWAVLIGPIHLVMFQYNGVYANIPDSHPLFTLAIPFLTALKTMAIGDTGAYYFTPRNTWFGFSEEAQNIGSSLSIENQGSLLAGLKMLYDLISNMPQSVHRKHLPELETMITNLAAFILNAFNKDRGFFRQGATYDPKSKVLTWGQNGEPIFAVDCQTWVSSVIGSKAIDEAYGEGATLETWVLVKQYANYSCPNGQFCGVGYTFSNYSGQVLSGEWTYGAMNWISILANETQFNESIIDGLQTDISDMNYGTYSYVVGATSINNSTEQYDSVLYADSRYYIPFGWFANPLPSLASTGWAVFVANKFNPFQLNGYLQSSMADYPHMDKVMARFRELQSTLVTKEL
jgi:hypothetical protein